MHHFNLKVIDKPLEGAMKVHARSDAANDEPFMSGEGNCTFRCGHCEHVLLKKISFGTISQIVLRCPKCRNYNQT